ncbi:MAG: mannonate dehydratase [Burkholderiaceae bacterium]
MRQTWRWFGPQDRVSIDDMLQAGVEGVVSALHHIADGEVWSAAEIAKRQREIGTRANGAPSGLAWEIVESLPVSEAIKKQDGDWRRHIENYKTSLRHLAEAGIHVVVYNFMPVLDWTRTDLAYELPTGATCMRFDFVDFAAFDIHLLQRPGADTDYPPEVVRTAGERFAAMSEERRVQLSRNVVFGLPGATGSYSMDDVRRLLAEYSAMPADTLRKHLVDFLEEVAPLAQSLGMRLACHPDDPPFPLLGLPRIMSTEDDYRKLIEAVDIPANGIALCAGSLGARGDNDLPGMVERLGGRVHFMHLRNVKRESTDIRGSFFETEHLGGDNDMVAMIDAILRQEKARRADGRADPVIAIRPDHGLDILDDLRRRAQPGYPAIGRLKGLAEIRGVMTALERLHARDGAGR